jgi:NADPH:quinone reductase-like Zn-dependent oxidoreductase
MRRWISGKALGIDGLSIEEVFAPEPKDNEILIEVRAASLIFQTY